MNDHCNVCGYDHAFGTPHIDEDDTTSTYGEWIADDSTPNTFSATVLA